MRILLLFLLCSFFSLSTQAQIKRYHQRYDVCAEFLHVADSLTNVIPSYYHFNPRCEILSFVAYFLAPRAETIFSINKGNAFSSQMISLMGRMRYSHSVYFEEIKFRCPSDTTTRTLGGFEIRVKKP